MKKEKPQQHVRILPKKKNTSATLQARGAGGGAGDPGGCKPIT